MKISTGGISRCVATGMTAVMILGALLPLMAAPASANNLGNLNNGLETAGVLNFLNTMDTGDFLESLNNYVAVMVKPNTDFDLRIYSNVGGGGVILSSSTNAQTTPELCIWNGNGAGSASQRSAEVLTNGFSVLPNQYNMEYEIANTIPPNTLVTDTFNNNDMLDVFQVYLTAGINYTFKFLSVSNNNADYRFFLMKPAAGQWANMASSLASGGFWSNTYTNTNYTPPAGSSGYYGVAVMQFNNVNTNYQFVVGAPDLTVTGISISPTPLTIGMVNLMPQNRPFTFTATVYNQGYGDAGPFNVSSYNDLVPWGIVSHGGLAARASTSSTSSYKTANPDTHVLNITVDAANAVLEDGSSGPTVADSNNNNSRTDCIAEVRAPYSNDFDDSVPSPLSYNYYYYTYYLSASDSQTFSLWNATFGTDFDMYLYGPTGTLVATAASTAYPERFTYYSASGGYHFIQVLRASGNGTNFSFSVDNADPTIQIVQPGDGAYLKGAPNELRLDCADEGSGINDTESNPVFRVDGGAWTDMSLNPHNGYNYTANLDAGLLIDGIHTLEYMATDNAGNRVTTRESAVVDNTPPSACSIFNPGQGQYVEGPLIVKVSAADQIGLASVGLLFGENLAGLGTQAAGYDRGTGFWQLALDTRVYEDGPANVTPAATDLAGNVLGADPTSLIIDNRPPELAITWPANASYVGGVDDSITAEASDAAGCLTVRFRIDGDPWSDVPLVNGHYTAGWNSTAYTDGPHVIAVRATDGAGHLVDRFVAVVVDNTAPTALWGAPDENALLSGIFTVKVKALDMVGVSSAVLGIGGRDYPMTFNAGSGYFEYPLDTTGIADGGYDLNVTVHGSSDLNFADAAPRHVRVDNGFPALAVISPGQGEVVSGQYVLNLSASDAFLDRTEFRVDSLGWVRADSWNTSQHPDGPHTVTFRAVDMMGRVTEIALGLTIDNSLPSCAFIAPGNGSFVAGMVMVQVMATDAAGLAQVRLSGTGAVPLAYNPESGLYDAQLDTTELADGLCNFRAECRDMAGRTAISALQLKVDNTPPAVTVRSPTSASQAGEVSISVDIADGAGVSSVQARIDGGQWKDMMMSRTSGRYELKWPTGIKDNGNHRFEVRTEDSLGNKATSAYYFKVENPDYGWVVLVSLVVLIVLVVAAITIRGRKKRPEELLPPLQEPEPKAAPQPPKEFPLAGPQPYEQPGQSQESPQQPPQSPYAPQQQPSSPPQQLAMQWSPEQPQEQPPQQTTAPSQQPQQQQPQQPQRPLQ